MKRLNVLFVTHTLGMGGGANRSMLQLICELRENYAVNPIVVAPFGKVRKNERSLVEVCGEKQIQVIRAVVPWMVHSSVWVHRIKYLLLFLYFPILYWKIRRYDINLVHSNGSVVDLGFIISRVFHIPHIWHLREFGTENATFKPVLGTNHLKKVYNQCSCFIAISDSIKDSFSNLIAEKKIYRIYNGISTSSYNLKSEHKNEVLQFVIVGVVTPHKNQIEAVLAAKLLRDRKIKAFHLTLIGGGDEKYIATIKKIISQNQLDEYISILGLRNDVPQLLSKMDVGLMLSKSEAFGRVTIEYMFQNLAVIASNTGANPELINDGETGLLYEYGNASQLADCMQRMILDCEMMCDMARKGHAFALDKFPSTKNTQLVYSLYEKNIK